jgi:hypothetical protein
VVAQGVWRALTNVYNGFEMDEKETTGARVLRLIGFDHRCFGHHQGRPQVHFGLRRPS